MTQGQQANTVILGGGLDLATPASRLPPSRAIACKNYESAPRGYQSSQGFERVDGHPSPSLASYSYLPFKLGTVALTAGLFVTGATSGATGTLLLAGALTSGAYGAGTAVGYLVLRNVTGTFSANENLQVAAVTKAVSSDVSRDRGALNDANDTTWYRLAIDAARADIAAVPGGGPLRGTWMFQGIKYAFRDDAAVAPTKCVMFKATAAGWVAVDLGRRLGFTAGTAAIVTGVTITGHTSGATGFIEQITIISGTLAAGTAAGRLTLSGQVGNFILGENLDIGASLTVALAAGNSTVTVLQPSGSFHFQNHNFYGASNLRRMYGCDGVNRAFEFNGNALTPISTGMAFDKPSYLAIHKNQLFLTFAGGSLQNSAPGNPFGWAVILGAAEIGIGEEITNILSAVSGALVILGRNSINVLYGNGVADFQLVTLSGDAGSFANTAQNMKSPVYFDNIGLRELNATNNYGNFAIGSNLTSLVQSLIRFNHKVGVNPINSLHVRSKDQYRLFYSDGTGFTVYMGNTDANGNSVPEIMPFDLGKIVRCCCSYTDDGDEILLMGSDDGFVYQLDAGTSLDGAALEGFIRLAFFNLKSPALNKSWKKATLELDAPADTALGLVAEYDYGNPDTPPAIDTAFDVQGGGGFWNESTWNDFYWSTAVNGKAEAYLDGFGPSCSLTIHYSGIYQQAHTLQAVTYNYSPRGLVR